MFIYVSRSKPKCFPFQHKYVHIGIDIHVNIHCQISFYISHVYIQFCKCLFLFFVCKKVLIFKSVLMFPTYVPSCIILSYELMFLVVSCCDYICYMCCDCVHVSSCICYVHVSSCICYVNPNSNILYCYMSFIFRSCQTTHVHI